MATMTVSYLAVSGETEERERYEYKLEIGECLTYLLRSGAHKNDKIMMHDIETVLSIVSYWKGDIYLYGTAEIEGIEGGAYG